MSFTSSETIESFSSHCATGPGEEGCRVGEKEKGRRVKPSATQPLVQRVVGSREGAMGGLLHVCVWCRGGRKEDRELS